MRCSYLKKMFLNLTACSAFLFAGCQCLDGKKAYRMEPQVAAMEEACETYCIDRETGLVYTFLDKDTLLPPDQKFFADAVEDPWWKIEGFDMPAKYMHEDCGICTGSYLCAELLRYELTGKQDALERARRSYQALRHVYEVGKAVEPGYFPKLFGRRLSPETSTDQVLYACVAMESFLPYATDAEKAEIKEMIPNMVRFWMRRDYRYHYFRAMNDSWQWPLNRFPPLLLLAWEYSGNQEFLDEYKKLEEKTLYPEFAHLASKRKVNQPSKEEKNVGGWILYGGAGRITMDVMHFDLLLRHAPNSPHAEMWKEGIRTMWAEVKDAVALEGYDYNMFIVDFKTGAIRRMPGWNAVSGDARDGARTANSTHIVRAAMTALEHCPELAPEVIPVVEKVLNQFTFKDLTYADEPERFRPQDRYRTRLLSCDCVVNYLWAAGLLEKWKREHPEKPEKTASGI